MTRQHGAVGWLGALLMMGCASRVEPAGIERGEGAVAHQAHAIEVEPWWANNAHGCMFGVSADETIQTQGGDIVGLSNEWGALSGTGYGTPGSCDHGFVIDYVMPPSIDNTNPGWDWVWIHTAVREDIDESTCQYVWTNLKANAFWTYQGQSRSENRIWASLQGDWIGVGCSFDPVDDMWISSAYDRIRVASQAGFIFWAGLRQYSYFVTTVGSPDHQS